MYTYSHEKKKKSYHYVSYTYKHMLQWPEFNLSPSNNVKYKCISKMQWFKLKDQRDYSIYSENALIQFNYSDGFFVHLVLSAILILQTTFRETLQKCSPSTIQTSKLKTLYHQVDGWVYKSQVKRQEFLIYPRSNRRILLSIHLNPPA